MQYTTLDRQTLPDLAVTLLGSMEGLFTLAERLGVSITARLAAGRTVTYDEGDIIDRDIARRMSASGLPVATDISTADMDALLASTDPRGHVPRPSTPTDSVIEATIAGWQEAEQRPPIGPGLFSTIFDTVFTTQFI